MVHLWLNCGSPVIQSAARHWPICSSRMTHQWLCGPTDTPMTHLWLFWVTYDSSMIHLWLTCDSKGIYLRFILWFTCDSAVIHPWLGHDSPVSFAIKLLSFSDWLRVTLRLICYSVVISLWLIMCLSLLLTPHLWLNRSFPSDSSVTQPVASLWLS